MSSLSRLFVEAQADTELGLEAMYRAIRDLACATLVRKYGSSGMECATVDEVAHQTTSVLVQKAPEILARLVACNPELTEALTLPNAHKRDRRAADRVLNSYVQHAVMNSAVSHFRAQQRERRKGEGALRQRDGVSPTRNGLGMPVRTSCEQEEAFAAGDARRVLNLLVRRVVQGRPPEVATEWRDAIDKLQAISAGYTTVPQLIAASPRPEGHDGAWPPDPRSPLWIRARGALLRRHSRARARLSDALDHLERRGQLTSDEAALGRQLLGKLKRR
jgi:hypothetical protein